MTRGVAATRSIALTYDDGPNPDGTRRVLELLAWRDVRATFFVWGEAAERHPEVVREVIAAGHSVQPHCFRHISHWERGRDEIAGDIDTVMELLRNLGAGPLTLWRPPYGRCLAGATAEIAAERGLELAGWTIDACDYDGRDPVAMQSEVTDSLREERETVVLLHDGHREHGSQTRRPDAGNTVALTGLLLAEDANAFTVLEAGLVDGLELGPVDEA
ncbi:MAG TPA: polysaccharide deacetylase family protein [Solirubrobacteraceae bacterium]|jgi:peptidoglycan/xylan/chitin deacetylase (PgdA/CDA1 family)|nr:polysaccharide deacetylase family protein [Solirubrobacteraceae bacterium]